VAIIGTSFRSRVTRARDESPNDVITLTAVRDELLAERVDGGSVADLE
jgi:hypothetical protein